MLDLRPLELPEELPRVRAQRLDVAALALGVERVEGEARLARAAGAGEDDELALRDREVVDGEVVLARADDLDEVGLAGALHGEVRFLGAFGDPVTASRCAALARYARSRGTCDLSAVARSGEWYAPAMVQIAAAETLRLGDLEVARLGFGAMRLPGPEVWGEPEDPARAREVLRRVVSLGINLIDTAWYYGPHVANRLIAETIHPYPKDLVIATKLGGKRLPDKGWAFFGRPEELREGCETDLRELRRDVLDVVHFRYMGKHAPVSFTESLDAMIALKNEGKIRHLALSNVGVAELEIALARTPIVAVQNLYSVAGRRRGHRQDDARRDRVPRSGARGLRDARYRLLAVLSARHRRAHEAGGARGGRGRAAPRDARADRPRVAPRAFAGDPPDPGDEPARARRRELEGEDDRPHAGRGRADRRRGALDLSATGPNGKAGSASARSGPREEGHRTNGTSALRRGG